MVDGRGCFLEALRLEIIHHVTVVALVNFARLLMEGVSGVHQGVLHVHGVLTNTEIHGVGVKCVTERTLLNRLLRTLHVLVTERLETISVLHIDLIKVRKWHMCPILRLYYHIRWITVILTSIIDSVFIQKSLSPCNIHITIRLLEHAGVWPLTLGIIPLHDLNTPESCLGPFLMFLFLLLLLGNNLLPSDIVIKVTHMWITCHFNFI